jgi:hypothetical protein
MASDIYKLPTKAKNKCDTKTSCRTQVALYRGFSGELYRYAIVAECFVQ